VPTATRTDTNIQANLSVTANFAILQYSVAYAAGSNGSISGSTSQTVNHGSDATAVTAVPNSGYQFVSWSDGVPTATRTDTNIQANLSVTANFTILQYSVAYAAGPNGTISGSTSQTVNHGSDATAVTAVPDAGYQFVSWSDGVLTATRTDTNIQANLSVTANFGLGGYAAWISAFPTITNPDDRLPGADPDKDGLANSVEFVTGTNPSQPTGGNVVSADVDGSNVVFEFERVKSAGEAGFASFIEVSGSLNSGSWTTPSGGQVVVTDHGTTETVTVTVPAPPDGRMFGRIRVTSP
jgi:hypothetical protein